MRFKASLLLTFLGLGLMPLLLLAGVNYWTALRMAETTLQRDEQQDLNHFRSDVGQFLALNKIELERLSRAKPLVQYLESLDHQTNESIEQTSVSGDQTIPSELQSYISSILNPRTNIARVAVFRDNTEPLFIAEHREYETYQPVDFRTKNLPTTLPKPEVGVWSNSQLEITNTAVSTASIGSFAHFTVPVFSSKNARTLVGAVVAEVRLDPVFRQASRADQHLSPSPSRMLIVVDRSGKVLHHTNEGIKNHFLFASMGDSIPVGDQITTAERGRAPFRGNNGHEYSTTYGPLPALDVFVARATDKGMAFADVHRHGRRQLLIAALIGLAAGALLFVYWNRKTRGIQRVSEGVQAFAQGKLDHQIDLRSRDDLKPLADNVEVMKNQLRDQLAREAETQQFQSFVRLSAILTHDLKNAIEALSLTVSNMERHSDNAEFRVDAMKTLRGATDDLRSLVTRLSNPVTTLSGEHKLPRVVDLVPVLQRVISKTTAGGPHPVKLSLPHALPALVDIERIDKVIENLVINAREAMAGKQGTITVEAGLNLEGKPFFSVSDVGEGMSNGFIQEHLFRPFATTKKRGVGLGLYTCREVIRANGGTIEVDSKAGVGTTFLVVLPSPPTDESAENVLRAHRR